MSLNIRFLGTGAAEGIPTMGCKCDHCQRAQREGGKLTRERNAIIFSLPGYELLVDTPPGIRQILARNRIKYLDGLFITHDHSDHSGGLQEFRYWPDKVDLFVEADVYPRLVREDWGEYMPELTFHLPYRPGLTVRFNSFFFIPFEVFHSTRTFGIAVCHEARKIVYISDSGNRFSNYSRCLMQDADLLIANTPFFNNPPGEAHIDVEETIALKERVRARQLILTHINHHNRPHDVLEAYARQFEGVTVAYDDMNVKI
jgi:phosphoribosyl 1,2-cyclic phosphate phosphodiesterase